MSETEREILPFKKFKYRTYSTIKLKKLKKVKCCTTLPFCSCARGRPPKSTFKGGNFGINGRREVEHCKEKAVVVVLVLKKQWIKQEYSNKKEQNYINLNATALYLIREILVLKRGSSWKGRKRTQQNLGEQILHPQKNTYRRNSKEKQTFKTVIAPLFFPGYTIEQNKIWKT